MPNNVTNNIYITGPKEILQEIAAAHFTGDDGCFDFNSLVPMPVSMRITSGGNVAKYAKYLRDHPEEVDSLVNNMTSIKEAKTSALLHGAIGVLSLIKHHTEVETLRKEFAEANAFNTNNKKYGVSDWYGWSNMYWGTKWNAYGGGEPALGKDLFCSFDTAWSPPVVLMIELAELYPEVEISHRYMDEGYGFAGIDTYANGLVHNQDVEDMHAFAAEEFGWEYDAEDDEE